MWRRRPRASACRRGRAGSCTWAVSAPTSAWRRSCARTRRWRAAGEPTLPTCSWWGRSRATCSSATSRRFARRSRRRERRTWCIGRASWPTRSCGTCTRGRLALLLPSMSEGFGLPAVEAAACGTAVIATTASPLPELLAGGGVFVAPGDDAALTAAMRRAAGRRRCAPGDGALRAGTGAGADVGAQRERGPWPRCARPRRERPPLRDARHLLSAVPFRRRRAGGAAAGARAGAARPPRDGDPRRGRLSRAGGFRARGRRGGRRCGGGAPAEPAGNGVAAADPAVRPARDARAAHPAAAGRGTVRRDGVPQRVAGGRARAAGHGPGRDRLPGARALAGLPHPRAVAARTRGVPGAAVPALRAAAPAAATAVALHGLPGAAASERGRVRGHERVQPGEAPRIRLLARHGRAAVVSSRCRAAGGGAAAPSAALLPVRGAAGADQGTRGRPPGLRPGGRRRSAGRGRRQRGHPRCARWRKGTGA